MSVRLGILQEFAIYEGCMNRKPNAATKDVQRPRMWSGRAATLGSIVLAVFSGTSLFLLDKGMGRGALEVPLRGLDWTVTSDQPAMFVIVALMHLLSAALFAWLSGTIWEQRSLNH
jgi:hypothetical protein